MAILGKIGQNNADSAQIIQTPRLSVNEKQYITN
jgi:hypothetical protein